MRLIEIENSLSPLQTGHSSKGNQLKWNLGDTWVKADSLGYEGLAEVLASRLLEQSTINNYVHYNMAKIHWQTRWYNGCVSDNFRSEEWQLVTLEKLYRKMTGLSLAQTIAHFSETKGKIVYLVDFVRNLTGLNDFGRYLATMLKMDAFFLNEDRHTNNIAVMYQPETGRFEYCPYFDFGAGFYSDMQGDYPLRGCENADAKAEAREISLEEQIEEFGKVICAKPICSDFDEQADAATALYGSDLKFTAGKRELLKIWAEIRLEYEESVKTDAPAICDRVETVLRMQIRKYGNLF